MSTIPICEFTTEELLERIRKGVTFVDKPIVEELEKRIEAEEFNSREMRKISQSLLERAERAEKELNQAYSENNSMTNTIDGFREELAFAFELGAEFYRKLSGAGENQFLKEVIEMIADQKYVVRADF